MRCVGVQDRFGQSALCYADLQEEYGLTAAHIADAVRNLLP
jgi:transketolase C-terminal domain/subunit